MNGIEMVIGKCLHIIKYDPVNNKNGETQDQLPGGFTGEIKCIEQHQKNKLFSFKTYENV